MSKRKRGRPRKPVDPDKPIRDPWRPVDFDAWLVFVSLYEKWKDHRGWKIDGVKYPGKTGLYAALARVLNPASEDSLEAIRKRVAWWNKAKRDGYQLIEFEGFTGIFAPEDVDTYHRLLAAGFSPRDAVRIISKGRVDWTERLPDWAIECLRSRE